MLPNSISVLGYDLELVKKRGRKNNRAYRLVDGANHVDIEFTYDPTIDILDQLNEIVRMAKIVIGGR